ncbi:hypothetical protein [Corynebacterium macginleyi]|uniref:hypothetical protein n=1 Tax=Corynebacterium macginleyi TaxID=38290 RepID=UPI00190D7584|nr:hypothetical protein [Corynebacterium macginleyi]MBK4161046.1 hypothetical protein [Corynebacterium macginleyi]
MSILFNQPPHTVTVVLRRQVKDRRGGLIPEEIGRVLCRGFFQESSVADMERYAGTGVAVADLKRFITMEGFPGDSNALVIDSDGVEYEVVGAPKVRRNSRMTSFDAVTLSAKRQVERWT